MAKTRKITVYFTEDVYQEMNEAAQRQDRSISWMVGQSWRIARPQVLGYPAVEAQQGTGLN